MLSALQPLAILSQSSLTIGLFDYYRIAQQSSPDVLWIKARYDAITEWVRPRAILQHNHYQNGSRAEAVQLLTSSAIRTTPSGEVDLAYTTAAVLMKLAYTVRFFENTTAYPLYTLTPDYPLPWNLTLHTSNTLYHVQQIPQRHWRLQNIPFTPSYMALISDADVTSAVRVVKPVAVEAGDTCAITLEPLLGGPVYYTPCGHPFSPAIEQALYADPRCPICRASCYFAECTLATA